MTEGAVLFDIDGTLVDSNYLHVDAWTRAFTEVGHSVEAWRVHRAIGMGGDQLLATLLGKAVAEPDIIRVALDGARVSADRAVMVGDAVWDVQACARASVRCIALLSGGTGRGELTDAGAVAVYDDASDLLDQIETSAIEELTN